ncbi:MAG: protein phosphatase 2C domain-containing protein [Deltaproteobacteria bacterium]|nr:protein phosphatase 2C domain-containing protein [Deltaproteobacteria bacterium]MBW2414866.1 protein phosphatase 2C domain-containing protein [Deltaproteobacteria bacterium]
MRIRTGFELESASLSDVGRTRSENQDACGETFDADGNRLLIVADGMGGHAGGSTASRICVESICREFRASGLPLGDRLRHAIERANADVYEVASENPELAGMGTTAVGMAIEPSGAAWVGWVGDSRAYRMRAGELTPITDDHSWVAEAVRMGVIKPEEAETHPRKNQLLRSVGASPEVEVDVRPVDIRAGDRFLICSDGLWGEVPEPEIAAVLGYEAPAAATRKLIDRANDHGGPDNITAQILAVSLAGTEPAAPAGPTGSTRPASGGSVRPRRLVLWAGAAAVGLAGFVAYALNVGGGGFPGRVPDVATALPSATEPAVSPLPGAQEAGASEASEPTDFEVTANGTDPPGSRVSAASGALSEPEPFPAPTRPVVVATTIDSRVEGFLGSWSRAVMDKSWPAYQRIGLPASQADFERDYAAREDLQMSFELLESRRAGDGSIQARVRMNYGYATPMGRRELQTEYRIRLRETAQGLRYVGGWN